MAEDLAAPSPAACCAEPDASSTAKCLLCGKAVCGKCGVLVNGKTTCAACRDAVLAELAKESEDGAPLGLAVGAGLAAAIACGIAWAALSALTGSEIGFVAVGVGWAVAQAVRRAAGGRRGPKLRKAGWACSVLGLVLGKYFIVAHLVRQMAATATPDHPARDLGWFDPLVFRIFSLSLPHMLTFYDALWVFLALGAVSRVLMPAKVSVAHARRNAAPAA